MCKLTSRHSKFYDKQSPKSHNVHLNLIVTVTFYSDLGHHDKKCGRNNLLLCLTVVPLGIITETGCDC